MCRLPFSVPEIYLVAKEFYKMVALNHVFEGVHQWEKPLGKSRRDDPVKILFASRHT